MALQARMTATAAAVMSQVGRSNMLAAEQQLHRRQQAAASAALARANASQMPSGVAFYSPLHPGALPGAVLGALRPPVGQNPYPFFPKGVPSPIPTLPFQLSQPAQLLPQPQIILARPPAVTQIQFPAAAPVPESDAVPAVAAPVAPAAEQAPEPASGPALVAPPAATVESVAGPPAPSVASVVAVAPEASSVAPPVSAPEAPAPESVAADGAPVDGGQESPPPPELELPPVAETPRAAPAEPAAGSMPSGPPLPGSDRQSAAVAPIQLGDSPSAPAVAVPFPSSAVAPASAKTPAPVSEVCIPWLEVLAIYFLVTLLFLCPASWLISFSLSLTTPLQHVTNQLLGDLQGLKSTAHVFMTAV